MSLTGSLARMVIGGLVAKGVRNMMRGKGRQTQQSGGGLGGLLGSVLGGGRGGGGGGLGSILGGARRGGGLGDILSGGGKQDEGALGDILGDSSSNRQSGGGGGLGDILEGLGGGSSGQKSAGGLGGILDSVLRGDTDPGQINTNPDQESQAEVLLRAMLNAAKADGSFDQEEQDGVLKQLGDVDENEAKFIRQEMQSPLDIQGFIKSVPHGMEQQVYMMSVLAIDLDSKAEARYLDELRKGLDITEQASNQIHEQIGAPALYS